jgi:hypothetical protein
MPSAEAVLLPKLFPSNLVSLGQIVRNALAPNVNTYTKSCGVVKDEDIAKHDDPEQPYKAMVSVDTRGRFDIGLTRLLGGAFNARSANLLSTEAERLEHSALKDATDILRRIAGDEDARNWINDMVLHKTPCYIVVGLQVLCNAEFQRVVLKEAGGGAHVTVPLEHTGQIPLHIQGELSADRFGKSTGRVSGVFGIQVQKLITVLETENKSTLQGDVRWQWTYQRVKGTQEEVTKQLSIRLEDVELDELVNLLAQDDAQDDEDGDER